MRYPEFNTNKNMPMLCMDLKFMDYIEFRKALRRDSLNTKYEYKHLKNEKSIVTLVCVHENRKWRIQVSWDKGWTPPDKYL